MCTYVLYMHRLKLVLTIMVTFSYSVILTLSISFLCHAVFHLKSLYVSLAVFCMVSFINLNVFFQSHCHKCSEIQDGCRPKNKIVGVWLEKGTGTRWWSVSIKICICWYVVLFIHCVLQSSIIFSCFKVVLFYYLD